MTIADEERQHQQEEREFDRTADWLAIFPEAKDRVIELLTEFMRKKRQLENAYLDALDAMKGIHTDEFAQYFASQLLKYQQIPKIVSVKKDIVRLTGYLQKNEPEKSGQQRDKDFHARIQRAKAIPIEDFVGEFTDYIRPGHGVTKIRCPFHQPDKTPSCVIFDSNNSFYCFGCGEGGDSIHFIQTALKLSFIEALKWLEERYPCP